VSAPDEYAPLAEHYHLIYEDWQSAIERQSGALDRLIRGELGAGALSLLDAACGIGTQALGLAARGYRVTGTDLSPAAVARAGREATARGLDVAFGVADMRALDREVEGAFDVVLAADNAVAHLLSEADLTRALEAMRARLRPGGLLVLTQRDYDALLAERPRTTAPSVFDSPEGRRLVLRVFDWEAGTDRYRTNLFLVRQSGASWSTLHWSAPSRAWRRAEVEAALAAAGLAAARWSSPPESGFFQPVVTARRR
jgi:glycine/sarcosine N-methyltransferase